MTPPNASSQGEAQAKRLAQASFWDEVTCVIHSAEAKTRLTVAPLIAQWNLPTWSEGRFDELRRPGWVANYRAQVAQAFATPDLPAGEWESARNALDRVRDGMTLLRKRFVTETVAVVGHGLTLSLYRAYLLGYPTARIEDWQQLSFAAVAKINLQTERMLQDFTAVAAHSPRNESTR